MGSGTSRNMLTKQPGVGSEFRGLGLRIWDFELRVCGSRVKAEIEGLRLGVSLV